MHRILYLIAMYSGVRAVHNTLRSFFLPQLRTSALDGVTLQIDETNLARVRVHARRRPRALGSSANAGMISIYLVSPGILRLIYFVLRLTSHFGVGHVEIAFFETDKGITIFAVRNIIQSNIHRLRLGFLFPTLKLSKERDEIAVLQRIVDELNVRGLAASLSPPEECVALAVNRSLIKSQTCSVANDALKRKYQRITKRIAMGSKAISPKRDGVQISDAVHSRTFPMEKLVSSGIFILVAITALATYVADNMLGVSVFTYSYFAYCFLAALSFSGLWHACHNKSSLAFGTLVFALLAAIVFLPPSSERLLRSVMLNAPAGTKATAIGGIVKQQYERSSYAMPRIYEDRAGGFDRIQVSLLCQKSRSCTSVIFIVENGRVSRSIFSPD